MARIFEALSKGMKAFNEQRLKSVESLDLANMEDRMMALEVSGEQTDHYKVLASVMFGVSYDQVTQEQRRAAKAAVMLGRYR